MASECCLTVLTTSVHGSSNGSRKWLDTKTSKTIRHH